MRDGAVSAGKSVITRVACIEDDNDLREMFGLILGDAGMDVRSWASATGAHAFLRRERQDVVLLDLHLGGERAGVHILEEMRHNPEAADSAVIICSGDTPFLHAQEEYVRSLGGAILEKPFDVDELLAMVRRAAARHEPCVVPR